MAVQINGNRQAADMGRCIFNINSYGSSAAAQSGRTYASHIDTFQQFFFKFCILRIRIVLPYLTSKAAIV